MPTKHTATTPKLGLVVPCYNEVAVLTRFVDETTEVLKNLIASQKISPDSFLLAVDDGSSDTTWQLMEELYKKEPLFRAVKLARNVGHEKAIYAGLMTVNQQVDAALSLDADFQDDIQAIGQFVDQFGAGFDIIYGVRKNRQADSFFKRKSAEWFYGFMRWLGVDIIPNHADYRLLSRRAIEALADYPETNLFLRGIFPLIGLPSTKIYYERGGRQSGRTKYSVTKLFSLAFEAVSSFSVAPLRFVTSLGLIVFIASLLLTLWVLDQVFLRHNAAPGWASTVIPLYFLGGLQMSSLGIIGEYVGKIYQETKHRPRYFIEKTLER